MPLDSLVPSLQTNLLSALYIVQPAIKHLRAAASAENPARVILVSSGASVGAYQAWGMYSLAKAGVNSLARTLAAEEKDGNVVFLSIRPGVVDVSLPKSRAGSSADPQTDVSGTILCGAGAVLRIAGERHLRSRSTDASCARSAPEPTQCPEKQAAAPLRTF